MVRLNLVKKIKTSKPWKNWKQAWRFSILMLQQPKKLVRSSKLWNHEVKLWISGMSSLHRLRSCMKF